jgi:hypothetical protein
MLHELLEFVFTTCWRPVPYGNLRLPFFPLSFSLQLSHLYALCRKNKSPASQRERERERDFWICLMQGSMLVMNKNENRNFATTRTKPRERQRKEEQRELGTVMRRKSNEQQ